MSLQRQTEKFLFLSVKLSGICLLILSTLGIYIGGAATFTGFFIVFGYYLFVESALDWLGVGSTFDKENEFEFISPSAPNWLDKHGVLFFSVSQLVCLPVCIYLLTFSVESRYELVGGVLSLMFSCGSIGGLAGHDLIHQPRGLKRWIGLLTLGTMNYSHFAISHVLGHHVNVGTREDWSTARYKESLYHFLYRAVWEGYLGSWTLEAQRVKRKYGTVFTIKNEMIQLSLLQGVTFLLLFAIGGLKMLLIQLIFSVVAVTFLEIVNYVSHYGLVRGHKSNGRLDRIRNIHSWESDNKVSNWFVFNTGKHCHHHTAPQAKNYELALSHENASISYGLQAMTLISLIPPLYFRVMDKFLEERGIKIENNEALPIVAQPMTGTQ